MLALLENMNNRVFCRDVSTRIWAPRLIYHEEAVVYVLRQRNPREVECIDRDESAKCESVDLQE